MRICFLRAFTFSTDNDGYKFIVGLDWYCTTVAGFAACRPYSYKGMRHLIEFFKQWTSDSGVSVQILSRYHVEGV